MCPCPGSGRGESRLGLNNIEDPQEFDHFVLSLFEKNLVIEAAFYGQQQRYYLNQNDALVTEATHPVSLRITVSDDKVTDVLAMLDAQNIQHRSSDVNVSPVLKGGDFTAWQQSQHATTGGAPAAVVSQWDDEDDYDAIAGNAGGMTGMGGGNPYMMQHGMM